MLSSSPIPLIVKQAAPRAAYLFYNRIAAKSMPLCKIYGAHTIKFFKMNGIYALIKRAARLILRAARSTSLFLYGRKTVADYAVYIHRAANCGKYGRNGYGGYYRCLPPGH